MKRLVVVLVLLLGCDGAARRDAEGVVNAVARFRAADDRSSASALGTLRSMPCSAPDVCAARDACVTAGDATARAVALKDEVAQGLTALESGKLAKDSPAAQALPKKLDEAESLLKKGHDSMPACDEQVLALKRKHRL